jgi:DNA polymerase elongation subunit (family B)
MSKKVVANGREWTTKEINFLERQYQAGYSRVEISKNYKERFRKEGWTRSPDSIKNAINVYCQHVTLDLPRVLFLDIETKPAKAFVWQQFENDVPLEMLIEDGAILSFCAKWAGEPESKVIYMDQRGKEKNLMNDKKLMQALWKLLDEADIVVAHNGNRFDIPKINARFIAHGLGAPSVYKKIDTLTLARSNFSFFSNKLQHLSGMFAKKHKKDSHKDFPGFALWDQCMKGNKKAWESMKKYNIIDVLALEEVFLELSKYVKGNKNVTSALRVYGK